jgi:hypothetical protein
LNHDQRNIYFEGEQRCMTTQAEQTFFTLPQEERDVIISHGAALRLSDLKNRHFLATSKLRQFEEIYHTSLMQLEQTGLPDDADYAMHEAYIMWRHWAAVAEETTRTIKFLEEIAQEGLFQRNIG